ncbi:hypothetical protein Tsp_00801 [Trichinella spiralis]|uniref:hypothetical protein n=1 Tax=Trichinella spiralis TaxID=6334 RepID=UPI0001EFCE54|nr:hypothetical protein Tsp_00801 [Trichinella spiralis]
MLIGLSSVGTQQDFGAAPGLTEWTNRSSDRSTETDNLPDSSRLCSRAGRRSNRSSRLTRNPHTVRAADRADGAGMFCACADDHRPRVAVPPSVWTALQPDVSIYFDHCCWPVSQHPRSSRSATVTGMKVSLTVTI